MVILFGLSLLFILICVSLGSYFSGLLITYFKTTPVATSSFLLFLTGFILTGTFCNIWSLLWPVNQYAFMALAAASFSTMVNVNVRSAIWRAFQQIKSICQPSMLLLTVPVLLVWFVFSLLSPQHGDSAGYHYASIRWIEEYKVIPGLANLQGRFGFNSSFFTTSAAFTLPGIAGQPVYPLNLAFSLTFFGWILHRISVDENRWRKIVYALVLILMIRGIILTISSPTPDIIAAIIILYVLMGGQPPISPAGGLYDLRDRPGVADKIIMCLLIVFAVTVKLSCLFLLPVILLYLFQSPLREKRVWIVLAAGSVIILAPWLARNYLLSGYFIYPLSFTGLLHPDWKVPYAVLHFDRLLINNGPKLIGSDWEAVSSLPFIQWFPLWVKANLSNGLAASFALLVISLLSLIRGMVTAIKKKQCWLMAFLLINLFAVLLWMITSPDYRFAYGYLVAGVALPFLLFTKQQTIKPIVSVISFAMFLLACGYYVHYGSRLLTGYSIAKYWLKPVPPPENSRRNNLATFKSIELKPGIRLYTEDAEHDCNNAPLPCFGIFFQTLKPGWIKARGERMEDGFRIESGKLK